MDLLQFLGLTGKEDVQAAVDEAHEGRASPATEPVYAVLQDGALDMEQAPWFPKMRQAILDETEVEIDAFGQHRGRNSKRETRCFGSTKPVVNLYPSRSSSQTRPCFVSANQKDTQNMSNTSGRPPACN
jgi:hypothetical protein